MLNPVGGYGKADRGAEMVKKITKRGKMVKPGGRLKPFTHRSGGFADLPIYHFSAPTGFAIFSARPTWFTRLPFSLTNVWGNH